MFTCQCGYETTDPYTVDVINELTGCCPVCNTEASVGNFKAVGA